MRPGTVTLLWLVAATPAAADPWTLGAVLDRARSSAPEVTVAALRLTEAEASRVGQGVPLTNPRLFGDYRFLAKEQEGAPADPFHGYLVGMDALFEVSGASGKRVDEADRRVDLAYAELGEERVRAAARAFSAYIELRAADRLVTSARDAETLASQAEFAARERLKTGAAGEPDVTLVAVEVALIRVLVQDSLRRQRAAQVALEDVLDLPHDSALQLLDESFDLRPVPTEAEALDRAFSQRPDLAAQRARVALVEATDERLSRETWPELGVDVGLDGAPASPVFGFVGLSVELPVAQRNQGPRAIAQAQRDTESLRLAALERRVTREVALALANYSARAKSLEFLTKDALPNAERTHALVQEGWRAGRFDIFRFTSASRQLLAIQKERIDTLRAAWLDYVELQRVSGGLTR